MALLWRNKETSLTTFTLINKPGHKLKSVRRKPWLNCRTLWKNWKSLASQSTNLLGCQDLERTGLYKSLVRTKYFYMSKQPKTSLPAKKSLKELMWRARLNIMTNPNARITAKWCSEILRAPLICRVAFIGRLIIHFTMLVRTPKPDRL